MKTLNIIGCGNVGKTLTRLWANAGVFEIQDIVNRSRESTMRAVQFVGDGHAADSIGELRQADLYLISVSDNYILACCDALAASGALSSKTILFHCSGAIASTELRSAIDCDTPVASVHPVMTFTGAENSTDTFAGTYCGMEGHPAALDILRPAFERIGGIPFIITPESKTFYHAASVIVCNYLNALMEVGVRTHVRSGLSRETALAVMEPIVRGTIDNIFRLDTAKALTGPIARGDDDVVARQHDALRSWDERIGRLYRDLGAITLALSRAQGTAHPDALARIEEILEKNEDRRP